MSLKPLGDRVVLKQLSEEAVTTSGIMMSVGKKEMPNKAKVIAVGPGTCDVKMEVKVDDIVIFSKFAATEVSEGNEEYLLVRQEDILAIIE
ncbi:MAG: co-chaperone GroES [Lachnospirales bacterium]